MIVRVVLLDLDDTLIYEEASDEAAFMAACERARERRGIAPQALCLSIRRRAQELWDASPTLAWCNALGVGTYEGLWGQFAGNDPNLKALREWTPGYRREAWTRALADCGVRDPKLTEELADLFGRERRARHDLLPDAEAVLRDLAGRYRLALLTNGAPDIQRGKLAGSGLEHFFEAVIVSGEAGIGKPDPRIFAAALDRLGALPEEVVMVGNSLSSDIAGAQRAGIRTVWLNLSGEVPPAHITPDAQIAALGELRHALSRFS